MMMKLDFSFLSFKLNNIYLTIFFHFFLFSILYIVFFPLWLYEITQLSVNITNWITICWFPLLAHSRHSHSSCEIDDEKCEEEHSVGITNFQLSTLLHCSGIFTWRIEEMGEKNCITWGKITNSEEHIPGDWLSLKKTAQLIEIMAFHCKFILKQFYKILKLR